MPAHSGGELFHSRLSTRSVFHIVAKQTFQALDDGGVFFDLKRGSSILAQFFQSRFWGRGGKCFFWVLQSCQRGAWLGVSGAVFAPISRGGLHFGRG